MKKWLSFLKIYSHFCVCFEFFIHFICQDQYIMTSDINIHAILGSSMNSLYVFQFLLYNLMNVFLLNVWERLINS